MQLISGVKIKYFRSIYTASLSRCRTLNIISGQNDGGKSNILKALNLFFNEDTDWDTYFDFDTDFSIPRRQQVKKDTVKGKQFVSIEIDFLCPPNYKRSLPPKFKVTKTWLRDDSNQESNNLESLEKQNLLPSTLETAKRFLSQFMNRIHFEYVPAVKDRVYYSHLLSTLQARLLDSPLDKNTAPLVGDLASHIQGQIGQLQEDFRRATHLDTFIKPPEELASLFQSFLVSTTIEGGTIPLVMRGDGMQARYVPSVLHYISSRSKDFFIWGFEEPENSLEYSHINSLAQDFEKTYAKEVQIFVTSHSPAFVSLHGDDTACYRAFKVDDKTNIVQVWPDTRESEHGELLLKDLGILKIQEEIHQQYAKELSKLEELNIQIKKLQNDLLEIGKPLLLVEGIFDKAIIEAIWPKLYGEVEAPFIIRVADPAANDPAGGAAGAQSVANMIEALHPDEGRKAIGLFDSDEEGFKCFEKLSRNFRYFNRNHSIKRHRNGLSFAILLPAPSYRTEYVAARNMTIELMFPDNVISRKTDEGEGLKFSEPNLSLRAGKHPLLLDREIIEKLGSRLAPYKTISSGKDIFAGKIVPRCSPDECQAFRPLFTMLLDLLGIKV